MKIRIPIILAATLVFAACDKQQSAEAPAAEPAVEAPSTLEPTTDEAPSAEGASAAPAEEAAPAQLTAVVGKPAPEFELVDEKGKTHKLSDYRGKIVVLEWTNPGCPVVGRHYDAKTMQETAASIGTDIVWLAVDSTHTVKPEDSDKWKGENGFAWPVLQDPSGKTGVAYGAKTTPHMYVVDAEGALRYAGAIDDDPHGKKDKAERVNYVIEAVTSLSKGEAVAMPETTAYGCSVKYKS